MPGERQLDIWPDSLGEDREKKPVVEKSYGQDNFSQSENQVDEPVANQEEDKEKNLINPEHKIASSEGVPSEVYRPRAEEIMKRMKEAPGKSPEEVAQKIKEHYEKVFPSGPTQSEEEKMAEQTAIARIVANLKKMSETDYRADEKSQEAAGAQIIDDDHEDPWSQINPPSMWSKNSRKKYK